MTRDIESKVGCFLIILIVLAVGLVTMWTDRSIDFWLTYSKGTEVNCPWWLSALLTVVLNGVVFLFNVVTEIFRLVL